MGCKPYGNNKLWICVCFSLHKIPQSLLILHREERLVKQNCEAVQADQSFLFSHLIRHCFMECKWSFWGATTNTTFNLVHQFAFRYFGSIPFNENLHLWKPGLQHEPAAFHRIISASAHLQSWLYFSRVPLQPQHHLQELPHVCYPLYLYDRSSLVSDNVP